MMNELLVLDDGQVQKARELARAIAREVQREIELHTTVSIERTAARLFGIDGGVDGNGGVPLPNVVVDQVFNGGGSWSGGVFPFGLPTRWWPWIKRRSRLPSLCPGS